MNLLNENFVTMNPLHVTKTQEEHNQAIAYMANVEAMYADMKNWLPNQKEDTSYVMGMENGWTGNGQ